MSGAFPPKVVAAGEGKTVMLFGVRFGYKVVSGDSGGRLAVLEAEIPPRTPAAASPAPGSTKPARLDLLPELTLLSRRTRSR